MRWQTALNGMAYQHIVEHVTQGLVTMRTVVGGIAALLLLVLVASCGSVGNQQKWDTFVKERSGGNGSVVGLPEQVVVAFAAG